MNLFRRKSRAQVSSLPRAVAKISDDLSVSYVDKGRGAPIVFVPGFTFSIDLFIHQLEHFSQDYRFIAIDPRSHGHSSKTLAGNDYPQHGRDLDVFFKKLKLSEITLVGWSFGALSAWSYAEQFGLDRLKAFVCIDMPPVPMSADEQNGAWVEGTIADLAAGYHVLLDPSGQRGFMEDYAQHVMVQRDLSEPELKWIADLSLQTPTHAVKDLFASGLFSNYLEIAQRLDQQRPNMFVIANHWAEVATGYIQREFPNSQIETLGGHMMFWEHPEQFNARLKKFLVDTV